VEARSWRSGARYAFGQWHAPALTFGQAGVLHNEHNAIADILAASAFFRGQNVDSKQLVPDKAAAQHLSPHPNGFSSSVSLCSYSAGAHLGMLAVNLKPDAFEAVVLRAGVYDMVRLHHYGAKNTTRSWVTQHGDITLEAHRAWIPALNPLTTVKQHEGREAGYKAILLDVSENDGTVHALHSFKQTAELQLKNKANAEGERASSSSAARV
jgi:prolyl oligopeptidase PreP (S9A serine peptidase family)